MIMAAPIICTQCGCQLQNDSTCKNCEYLKANKMKQKKTFSVDDGTLVILDNEVNIFVDNHIIASTKKGVSWYPLPQSILYPTDEELAESYTIKEYDLTDDEIKEADITHHSAYRHFLAGRQSHSDKKFHLSEDELRTALIEVLSFGKLYEGVIEKILKDCVTPTFPHTITVEHDGNNLWETLKAEYE